MRAMLRSASLRAHPTPLHPPPFHDLPPHQRPQRNNTHIQRHHRPHKLHPLERFPQNIERAARRDLRPKYIVPETKHHRRRLEESRRREDALDADEVAGVREERLRVEREVGIVAEEAFFCFRGGWVAERGAACVEDVPGYRGEGVGFGEAGEEVAVGYALGCLGDGEVGDWFGEDVGGAYDVGFCGCVGGEGGVVLG